MRLILDWLTSEREGTTPEARRIRTVNAARCLGLSSPPDAFYIATFIATGDSTLTLLILFVTGFVATV